MKTQHTYRYKFIREPKISELLPGDLIRFRKPGEARPEAYLVMIPNAIVLTTNSQAITYWSLIDNTVKGIYCPKEYDCLFTLVTKSNELFKGARLVTGVGPVGHCYVSEIKKDPGGLSNIVAICRNPRTDLGWSLQELSSLQVRMDDTECSFDWPDGVESYLKAPDTSGQSAIDTTQGLFQAPDIPDSPGVYYDGRLGVTVVTDLKMVCSLVHTDGRYPQGDTSETNGVFRYGNSSLFLTKFTGSWAVCSVTTDKDYQRLPGSFAIILHTEGRTGNETYALAGSLLSHYISACLQAKKE